MNIGYIIHKENDLKNKLSIIDTCKEQTGLTYQELDRLTDNMSGNLMELGVKPGDIVMVMLSNCIELQICYFSCFKAGAIMQPLNYFITENNIYFASSQCKPKIFITNEVLWVDKVRGLKDKMPWISNYYCVGQSGVQDARSFEELLGCCSVKLFPVVGEQDFGQLFFVFSDSKTKFHQRGVFLTHHVMEWHSYPYTLMGLNEKDIVAGILHPYNALTRAVFHSGATYLLITDFCGEKFIEDCLKYGITFFGGTPDQFREILEAAKKNNCFPKTLRACFSVGKLLDINLWKEFEECFNTRVYGGMGCKELGIFSVEPYNSKPRYGSIGKIIPYMEYKIEETDKKGNTGYLSVKSHSLITHYWIDGGVKKVDEENGWFKTGIEVSVDEEGYFYLTGNVRDTSISGMKRYYNVK
ncbi:MAG: class I adenylate-forming enzyme family protein [Anaerocolumna sp.]